MALAPISHQLYFNPAGICRALDTTDRQSVVAKLPFGLRLPLKKILSSIAEGTVPLEQGKADLCSRLASHPRLVKFIESAQNDKELAHKVSSLQRDLMTTAQEFNVRLAAQGMSSPPLLVNFSRVAEDRSRYKIQFVQKWTDLAEISGSHSYQRLCLPGGYKVPRTAGFDFKEKTFVDTAGNVSLVAQETLDLLSYSLQSLNEKPANKDTLMVTDLISGTSLEDFIKRKEAGQPSGYEQLSPEQKNVFWRRIGQLACSDYVLGHTDRLIKAEDNTRLPDELNFSFGSNLGNILVEDMTLDLYAIDNGLEQGLERSSQIDAQQLMQAACECIQSSLVDFDPRSIAFFSEDLKRPDTHRALIEGIIEMQTQIAQAGK